MRRFQRYIFAIWSGLSNSSRNLHHRELEINHSDEQGEHAGTERSVSFDKNGTHGLAGNVLTFITFRKILHSLSLWSGFLGKKRAPCEAITMRTPSKPWLLMVSRITMILTPSDAALFHPARGDTSPSTPMRFPVFAQIMSEIECLVCNQAPKLELFTTKHMVLILKLSAPLFSSTVKGL